MDTKSLSLIPTAEDFIKTFIREFLLQSKHTNYIIKYATNKN